jgi:uncharacterized membrane protein YeaQ/YmgE (transglycosylase-associated protein family)
MDFTITLGYGAWALMVAAALIFGIVAQYIGETHTGYEWLVDAVAFFAGALIASEFVTAWRTIEPVWDQMALVPALLGGLVLGIVVELVTRFATGGRYTMHHGPMSA